MSRSVLRKAVDSVVRRLLSAKPRTAARPTTFESLEARQLLSTVAINFQASATTDTPSGYLADTGATFANRGNGYSYGWSTSNTANMRDRNAFNSYDNRYDTVAFMNGTTTWKIALTPNTDYQVRVIAGDPGATSSNLNTLANGTTVIPSFVAGNVNNWADRSAIVSSGTSGEIVISNGTAASNNRLQFIEITPTSELSAPSAVPTNVNVVAANYYSADVLWDYTPAAGEKVTGFKVERKWTGSGADNVWREAGTVGADQHYFNDTRNGSDTWQLWANKSFIYRVSAYNSAGSSSTSSEASVTTPNTTSGSYQAPFNNSRTPWSVDGKIEAENFDTGGQNVAFNDGNTANNGYVYRNSGVDVTWSDHASSSNRGYMIAWTAAGEWTKYSVNVPSAGTYLLEARVSYHTAGGTFHVEFDGVDKTGPMSIPNTGNWHDFTTLSIPVTLAAGTQTMAIKLDTIGTGGHTGNLDWIQLRKLPATPTNLAATAASSSVINLAWTDTSNNESRFDIYKFNGTTFAKIGEAPANATSVPVTGLSAATNYRFKIKAHNDVGDSDFSNEADATTEAMTGPSIVPIFGGSITVNEGQAVTLSTDLSGFTFLTPVQYEWAALKNGQPFASGSDAAFTFTPDDNGNYSVSLKINDDEGAGSTTVTAVNVAPTIEGPASRLFHVDDTGILDFAISDLGSADTHTASINWGDGVVESVDVAEGAVHANHIFDALSTFNVVLTVTDDDGASDTHALTITSTDVAPAAPSNVQVSGTAWIDHVEFTWQNNSPDADRILVIWNGKVIDELDGNATGYLEEFAALGTQTYEFRSELGMDDPIGETSAPLTVSPVAPPVAWSDNNTGANDRGTLSPYAVPMNSTTGVEIDVESNDIDYDSSSLSVAGYSNPVEGGTLSYSVLTGLFTYKPKPGFVGTDTFTYFVNDGYADSAATTVAVDVTDVPIEASDGEIQFAQNSWSHLEGDADDMISGTVSATGGVATLVYSVESEPVGGEVEMSPSGGFIYTRKSSFRGFDQFTYKVTDGYHTEYASIDVVDHHTSLALGITPLTDGYFMTRNHDLAPTYSFSYSTPQFGQVVTTSFDNATAYSYVPNNDYYGADQIRVTYKSGALSSKPMAHYFNNGPNATAYPVNAYFDFDVDALAPLTSFTPEQTHFNDLPAGWTFQLNEQATYGTVTFAKDANNHPTGGFTYEPTVDPETKEVKLGWDFFNYRLFGPDGEYVDNWVQLDVRTDYEAPPLVPKGDWTPVPFNGTIVDLNAKLGLVETKRDSLVRKFAELGTSWKSIDQDMSDSTDTVFDLATASTTKLDQLQSLYVTYLQGWLELFGNAASYQRTWAATFDNITNNEIYSDVMSGLLNLPQDIGGLKPNVKYLNDIEQALNAFGEAAGIQVQRNATIVNVTNTFHKVVETAEYGASLASGGTYSAASLLTKEGIKQLVKTVAKNYVKDKVEQALLTPVMSKVLNWIPADVDPMMVQAGLLALQTTSVLKKSLPKCINGSCFVAGTGVITGRNADGTWTSKNIEDFRVGDLVLSRDQYNDDGTIELHRVTNTFVKTTNHIRVLSIQDVNGNVETIRTTDDHPFWVEGLGWVAAGNIDLGSTFSEGDESNDSILISSKREEHSEGITVFNLEVAGDHTYFVDDGKGSIGNIWVHNNNRCKIRNAVSSLRFRGATAIDPLRTATHQQIANAFNGTGLRPSSHFIMRVKDIRTQNLGLHTFGDLEKIFKSGSVTVQDAGKILSITHGNFEVIMNSVTGILITLKPR